MVDIGFLFFEDGIQYRANGKRFTVSSLHQGIG